MIFERLLNNIENNYKRHISGGHNFIPIGFNRFSKFIPGVIKSNYTIVTASSGVGKSKYVRTYYVVNVLEYIQKHPDLKVIIVVFSLELSAEEYLADILCGFLKRDYNIDISYRELLCITGIGEEIKINEDIINKLKQYSSWIDFFNTNVRIYTNIKNPYGIYKKCKDIVTQHIKGHESVKKDEEGLEVKFWNYEDDNIFLEVIIDHISLVQPEVNKESKQAMTLHQAMSKLSSDYLLTLKNYYQAHVIVVQQQNAEKEKQQYDNKGSTVDSKLEPSLDGLGDNKLTQRDSTEVIGMFAPDRHDIQVHNNYNVALMRDTYRSIKILKSRYSSPNKTIGLLFNGATGYFEELPKAAEFTTDRDYVKYLTEKGFIKDESKKEQPKSAEIMTKGKIKLGNFSEDDNTP